MPAMLLLVLDFHFTVYLGQKKDGLFLWDGSLLSNTPLREVIDASPKNHKRVYIVNLFPKTQKELLNNMFDIWHRARDIIHTDKTDHNIHTKIYQDI